MHGGAEQLLRGRDQVARHRVPPREADHLRGCRGTPPVRQADLPQYSHPLRGPNVTNLVPVVIYLLFFNCVVDYPTVCSQSNRSYSEV